MVGRFFSVLYYSKILGPGSIRGEEDAGFKYGHYKKKVIITEETKVARLNLAHRMLHTCRETDWGYTVFTDECSFWLSKAKPNQVWSKNQGLPSVLSSALRTFCLLLLLYTLLYYPVSAHLLPLIAFYPFSSFY